MPNPSCFDHEPRDSELEHLVLDQKNLGVRLVETEGVCTGVPQGLPVAWIVAWVLCCTAPCVAYLAWRDGFSVSTALAVVMCPLSVGGFAVILSLVNEHETSGGPFFVIDTSKAEMSLPRCGVTLKLANIRKVVDLRMLRRAGAREWEVVYEVSIIVFHEAKWARYGIVMAQYASASRRLSQLLFVPRQVIRQPILGIGKFSHAQYAPGE
jgi:hypothetical protein